MENQAKTEVDEQTQVKPTKKTIKILFVDSELGTRHLITNWINNSYAKEGFEAVSAGSVREAVRLLWNQRQALELDIMVIAWNLSGRTSGLDLVEIIRQIGFRQLPIFMLTSREQEPEQDRAIFLGVRGFFDKTKLDPDILMNTLKKFSKEFINYSPAIYEETDRVVKKKDGQEFGNYFFLRWRSPKGKLRGVCIGKTDENENVSDDLDDDDEITEE